MNANYRTLLNSSLSYILLLCTFHSCCAKSLHPQGQSSSPSNYYSINGHDHDVPFRKAPRSAFVSPLLNGGIFKTKRFSNCDKRLTTIPHPHSDSISLLAAHTNTNGGIDEVQTSGQYKEQTNHYHLTILLPAYNERYRIGNTLSSYMDCLSQTPVYQHHLSPGGDDSTCSVGVITSGSVSLLVVDDGSTDGTADYIRGKTWLNPIMKGDEKVNCWKVDENVMCISLPENAGKGAAIERGMAELTSFSPDNSSKSVRSVVLVADADGSGDISCIDNMLQSLEELISTSTVASSTDETTKCKTQSSFDLPPALVVGYRQYPESKSPLRSLLSWGFRTCVSLIFLGTSNLGVRDTQCGFKLMTTSAGKMLYRQLNLRKWTHDVEVVHRARLLGCVRIGECGVPWVDKEGSKLVSKASDAVVVSLIMLSEIATMRVRYALGSWKVTGVEE